MSTRSERLNRVKRGEEARQRVLSGQNNRQIQSQQPQQSSRLSALSNYDMQVAERTDSVKSAFNVPQDRNIRIVTDEDAMRAGSALARQSAEQNQAELTRRKTEANKQAFEAAGLGYGGDKFNEHMSAVKNTASEAKKSNKADVQDWLQRDRDKRNAQDPKNPALKFIKDNTVDLLGEGISRLQVNNAVGRGVSRFGQSAGKMGGVDTQKAGGAPILSTGSKFADKTADIAGSIAGLVVDPNVPIQGVASLQGVGTQLKGFVNKIRRPAARESVQPRTTLALPAPRPRGNANAVDTPDIINVPETEPRALPSGEAVQRQRYTVAGNNQALSRVMTDIKPEVDAIITPPTRRDLLIDYIQRNMDVPTQEVWNMPIKDLLDLGAQIRQNMDIPKIAIEVARKRGHDLPSLLDGNAPRMSQNVSRNAQERVYGLYPEELPNVRPPESFSVSQVGDVAAPVVRVGRAPQTVRAKLQQEKTQPVTVRARIVAESTPQATMTVRARMEAQQAESQVAATTVRASAVNKPAATTGQRGFTNTLRQSGGLNDEVSNQLGQSPNSRYTRITNEETVAKANQRISKGVDQAEATLLGKRKFAAEDVATGMRLIQELQSSGQAERAVTIAESLSKKLTEAGQTVQAASIWSRLSPEGALMAAQRKVNRVNENLLKGQEPSKISPQQAQDITDAATVIQNSGASKERAGTVMEIMERVRKGEDIATDERQLVADFVADAKRFLKPADTRPPRPARAPREMSDKRVRDRVTSFLEAQEQVAKERLRSKGVQISSNPIDIWADYAYIGALKLAKGTVKFADWSDHMVRELGENVRPMLRQVYEKAQDVLGQSAKKINEQTISKAERVAEGYVKSNQAMSAADVTVIRNLAQKVSGLSGKEQQIAAQELQAVLNGFEKVGIGRKISSVQYIFMLLNPKTQFRNIVGNELMYRLERLSRFISTPIDIAASKITGGPRTITFKRGPSVWDDFFKTTTDYVTGLKEGAVAGARGVNPEGLSSKYEIGGLAFRSKYNPLTYMEKALGGVMKGFDFAAYQRAVNQRMSEMAYLDALNKGIKGDDNIRAHMQTFMTNMDDAVHDVAKKYGQYATLQDDSGLSRFLTNSRRQVNKLTAGNEEFGLASLVLPFAKTPANLLLRGLDYSPAGIIKAVWQANKVLRSQPGKTDLTRADVITSVSRALMGSGLGAAAYWLADKGVMFGQSNKDKEVRNLQQQAGIRDFQINGSGLTRMLEAMATGGDIDTAAKIQEGDTLWSYEWAQPTSMPMAIGSNIYQGVKDKQSGWKTAGQAAVSGFGTLFNSSVLSGIREAFQIPPGEDNAVKAIGMNLVKQAPGMFTPSIVRNINSYMDGRIKETYTPDDMGAITSYAASSIPGLSQKMPQKVNTFGQPQTRPNSFIDVFVSPADRNKYQPTKEAQFVIDLLQESGDTRVAPRAVAKYLTGKDVTTNLSRKVDLTPEQYVKLQTIVGQESARLISLINPELPTDKKVELVVKALDAAGKLGRNELKKEVGIKATK